MKVHKLKLVLFSLFLSVCLSSHPLLSHETADTGSFTFKHPETDKRVVVFYARSVDYNPAHPPVLVLHGMRRNAWDYRDAWIELAQDNRLFVIVPYFTEVDYPDVVGFNLGNVFASETNLTRKPVTEWSYRLPEIIFEHISANGQTTATGYLAFGHSAGSQFLHRKLAFAPDARLLLAIAANAGWYTLPDENEPWPYGFKDTGIRERDLAPYLASNLFLLLGDQDIDPNHRSLRKTPEAMRQGRHRLERGHTFFEKARFLATEMQVPFRWQIQEVPGVAHNNAKMAPAAARIINQYIRSNYGDPSTLPE